MGIEGQYGKWLKNTYPKAFIKQTTGISHLYIDFNAFLHKIPRYHMKKGHYHICKSLFSVLTRLLSSNKYYPSKIIHVAMDGLAPMSKFFVQRQGREMRLIQSARKGSNAPLSLQFTPGTQIMSEIQQWMEYYFCKYLIKQKNRNHGLQVYINGSNVPGEGEHKIMIDLLKQSQQINKDVKKQNFAMIVGTDSDVYIQLMMNPQLLESFDDVFFHNLTQYPNGEKIGVFSLSKFISSIKSDLLKEIDRIDSSQVCRDIAALSLLVGNDYLPKIRGANIGSIHSTYIKQFLRRSAQLSSLQIWNNETKQFNFDALKELYVQLAQSIPKAQLERLKIQDMDDADLGQVLDDDEQNISEVEEENNGSDDETEELNEKIANYQISSGKIIDTSMFIGQFIKENNIIFQSDLPQYLHGLNLIGNLMQNGIVHDFAYEYRPRAPISLLDIINSDQIKPAINKGLNLDDLSVLQKYFGYLTIVPFEPTMTSELFQSNELIAAQKFIEILQHQLKSDFDNDKLLSRRSLLQSFEKLNLQLLLMNVHINLPPHDEKIVKLVRKWKQDQHQKLIPISSTYTPQEIKFQDSNNVMEQLDSNHNVFRFKL